VKVDEEYMREAVIRLSDSIEKAISTAEEMMESESQDAGSSPSTPSRLWRRCI